jgi:hypothetical protein
MPGRRVTLPGTSHDRIGSGVTDTADAAIQRAMAAAQKHQELLLEGQYPHFEYSQRRQHTAESPSRRNGDDGYSSRYDVPGEDGRDQAPPSPALSAAPSPPLTIEEIIREAKAFQAVNAAWQGFYYQPPSPRPNYQYQQPSQYSSYPPPHMPLSPTSAAIAEMGARKASAQPPRTEIEDIIRQARAQADQEKQQEVTRRLTVSASVSDLTRQARAQADQEKQQPEATPRLTVSASISDLTIDWRAQCEALQTENENLRKEHSSIDVVTMQTKALAEQTDAMRRQRETNEELLRKARILEEENERLRLEVKEAANVSGAAADVVGFVPASAVMTQLSRDLAEENEQLKRQHGTLEEMAQQTRILEEKNAKLKVLLTSIEGLTRATRMLEEKSEELRNEHGSIEELSLRNHVLEEETEKIKKEYGTLEELTEKRRILENQAELQTEQQPEAMEHLLQVTALLEAENSVLTQTLQETKEELKHLQDKSTTELNKVLDEKTQSLETLHAYETATLRDEVEALHQRIEAAQNTSTAKTAALEAETQALKQMQAALSEQKQQVQMENDELKRRNAWLETMADQSRDLEEENQELRQKSPEDIRRELKRLQEINEELSRENGQLTKHVAETEAELQSRRDSLEQLSTTFRIIEEENGQLRELQRSKDELSEKKCLAQQEEITELRGKLGSDEDLATRQQLMEDKIEELSKKHGSMEVLRLQSLKVEEENEEIKKKFAWLETLADQSRTLEEENQELRNQCAAAIGLADELLVLHEENRRLEEQVDSLPRKIEALEKENLELRSHQGSVEELTSRNHILALENDALLEENELLRHRDSMEEFTLKSRKIEAEKVLNRDRSSKDFSIQLQTLEEENSVLIKQLGSLGEMMQQTRALEEENQKLRKQLASLDDLTKQVRALEDEKEAMKDQLVSVEEANKERVQALEAMNQELTKVHQVSMESASAERTRVLEEVQNQQWSIEDLTKQVHRLEAEREILRNHRDSLEEVVKQTREYLERENQEMENQRSSIEDLTKQVQILEAEREFLRSSRDDLEEVVKQAQQYLEKENQELQMRFQSSTESAPVVQETSGPEKGEGEVKHQDSTRQEFEVENRELQVQQQRSIESASIGSDKSFPGGGMEEIEHQDSFDRLSRRAKILEDENEDLRKRQVTSCKEDIQHQDSIDRLARRAKILEDENDDLRKRQVAFSLLSAEASEHIQFLENENEVLRASQSSFDELTRQKTLIESTSERLRLEQQESINGLSAKVEALDKENQNLRRLNAFIQDLVKKSKGLEEENEALKDKVLSIDQLTHQTVALTAENDTLRAEQQCRDLLAKEELQQLRDKIELLSARARDLEEENSTLRNQQLSLQELTQQNEALEENIRNLRNELDSTEAATMDQKRAFEVQIEKLQGQRSDDQLSSQHDQGHQELLGKMIAQNGILQKEIETLRERLASMATLALKASTLEEEENHTLTKLHISLVESIKQEEPRISLDECIDHDEESVYDTAPQNGELSGGIRSLETEVSKQPQETLEEQPKSAARDLEEGNSTAIPKNQGMSTEELLTQQNLSLEENIRNLRTELDSTKAAAMEHKRVLEVQIENLEKQSQDRPSSQQYKDQQQWIGQMIAQNASLQYDIEKLREQQASMEALAEKARALEDENDTLTTLRTSLDESIHNKEASIEDLTRQIGSLSEDIETMRNQCDLTKKLEEQNRILEEENRDLETLRKSIEELSKHAGSLEQENEKLTSQLAETVENFAIKNRAWDDEILGLQKQLEESKIVAEHNRALKEENYNLNKICEKNEVLNEKIHSLQDENNGLLVQQKSMEGLVKRNRALDEEVDELKKQQREYEIVAESQNRALRLGDDTLKQLRESMAAVQNRIQGLEEEKSQWLEQQVSMNDLIQRNEAMDEEIQVLKRKQLESEMVVSENRALKQENDSLNKLCESMEGLKKHIKALDIAKNRLQEQQRISMDDLMKRISAFEEENHGLRHERDATAVALADKTRKMEKSRHALNDQKESMEALKRYARVLEEEIKSLQLDLSEEEHLREKTCASLHEDFETWKSTQGSFDALTEQINVLKVEKQQLKEKLWSLERGRILENENRELRSEEMEALADKTRALQAENHELQLKNVSMTILLNARKALAVGPGELRRQLARDLPSLEERDEWIESLPTDCRDEAQAWVDDNIQGGEAIEVIRSGAFSPRHQHHDAAEEQMTMRTKKLEAALQLACVHEDRLRTELEQAQDNQAALEAEAKKQREALEIATMRIAAMSRGVVGKAEAEDIGALVRRKEDTTDPSFLLYSLNEQLQQFMGKENKLRRELEEAQQSQAADTTARMDVVQAAKIVQEAIGSFGFIFLMVLLCVLPTFLVSYR